MRILQISPTEQAGGAESSAWNLFRAYRERGHTSWLVVGRKRGDDPDVFEIPRPRGWLRLANGVRRRVERYLGWEDYAFPGSRHLLDLVPERPDVVHAHNLHGSYFDLRCLAPLSRQVPVIVNLRDMWLLTGHCAHPLGCERWRDGCGQCPNLDVYPAIRRDATAWNWRRKRRIYRQSRLHVTAISQWLMGQVRSSMLEGVQYRTIPNAIDLSIFAPRERALARAQLGLPESAHVVLCIAQNPFKDYQYMEDALSRLQAHRDNELLFICLGRKGQDHAVGQGRITYPGFERDPQRMALYYRSSDVYIHAAKGEAFGKTIAEAMACGTPVVATAVDAIPEIVDDATTGYLVPHSDSSAMTRRVQELLDAPALRQAMGERAATLAQQRFGLTRQVDDFLSWYGEILQVEATEARLSGRA